MKPKSRVAEFLTEADFTFTNLGEEIFVPELKFTPVVTFAIRADPASRRSAFEPNQRMLFARLVCTAKKARR